jgi:hypothetical protein
MADEDNGVEIFLSYTWSKDIDHTIRKFSSDLENSLIGDPKKRDISIFYDKGNIMEGSGENHFKPILKNHLKSSKIMLVLLSPNWLESTWCQWEFTTFNISDRPIIPILWDTIESKKAKSTEIQEKVINKEHVNYLNKSDEEYKILVNRISEYLIQI